MRRDTTRIRTKDCEIRLVGVYHRYQPSMVDVEDAIFEERPGIVCVELPPDDYLKFLEVRSYLETELKVAMITACDIGSRVFLVDWEKSLMKERLERINGLGDREVLDRFEDGDIPGFLKLVRERTDCLNEVQEVLIHERDGVIARKISILEKRSQDGKIVGIVGHSHLKGVGVFLKHPEKLEEFLDKKEITVNEPQEVSCEEIALYR
ncbi:MAG: hypothetical protein ACE5HY_01560 [Candidatus Hydrothermarchaeales archaeon]